MRKINYTRAEIAARYRAKHPDKVAEISRRYREKHPERVKAASRRWRKKQSPERIKKYQDRWYYGSPAKRLLAAARRRAKTKGLPFALTYADILPLPELCPVLGIKLDYGKSGRGRAMYKNQAVPSLDSQ